VSSTPDPTPLDVRVAQRIAAEGPLPFDEVMAIALDDPDDGFWVSGGAAGRRGDFITSPEVGPLFGALVARALDRWWGELGEPDPFVVVEAGAGAGTLARAVVAAAPACAASLRYVLVERSASLRARQHEHLTVTAVADGAGDDLDRPCAGSGPDLRSAAELPAPASGGGRSGVVLANELLDNLPSALLERHGGAWYELVVTLGDSGDPGDRGGPADPGPGHGPLTWQRRPAAESDRDLAERFAPDAPQGARVPLARRARSWVRTAGACVDRGRLVLIDYGDTTASLASRPWEEWLRTYRGHQRGRPPLDALGSQDITCEVPWDQIVDAAPADRQTVDGRTLDGQAVTLRRQAEVLGDLGIDDLVAEGRRIWTERAHLADLEALRGRSRVREAEALTDAAGLGAFWVLEARIGPSALSPG
jgi:SAM-dependent MidA family methyltransferase